MSFVDSWSLSALTGLPRGAPLPPRPTRKAVPLNLVRGWLGPIGLMVAPPALSLLLWEGVVVYDGSLRALAAAGPADWLAHLPAPTWTALGIVGGWVAVQLALMLSLPGARFLGPVSPEGEQPTYRLNGVLAWGVTHVALVLGAALGLLRPEALAEHWGAVLATLNLLALPWCAFLYVKGRLWPSGRDVVWTGNPVFDFFQGLELHPRLLGVNLKQLINCRVSMMGWSAACLCFAYAQAARDGGLAPAMFASTAVLVLYLLKFFVWEGGYFHSMDIMHDRFGFYICWGVLVWVPAVYGLHAFYLVGHAPPMSWPVALGVVAVGVICIAINYAADEQRQRVRATGGQTTVWGRPPVLIRAAWTSGDGQPRESLLLASGWWRISRHFHYVPELGLAAAWTLPAGFAQLLPWFYWIFLFILLMDRARRDEKRCAAKYGVFWEEYRRLVPWRVWPGIY